MKITIFPDAEPGKEYKAVNGREIEVQSIEELHDKVHQYAWSPSTFKDGIRKNKNFLSTELMAIDIDDKLTLQEAKERLYNLKVPFSISTSKNHQQDKGGVVADRFRIIMPLEAPITDRNTYLSTWNHVKNTMFPELDESCKDVARFYFKSSAASQQESFSGSGNKISIIISKNSQKVHQNVEIDSIDDSSPILVTKSALEFLISPPEVNYNAALNKTVYELHRGGLDEASITALVEARSPWGKLNADDVKTIKSGIQGAQDKGLYKSLEYLNGTKFDEQTHLPLIYDEIDTKYLIYQDPKDKKTVLKINKKNEVKPTDISGVVSMINVFMKKNFGQLLQSRTLKSYADTWTFNGRTIKTEPLPMAFDDDPRLAYNRIAAKPVPGDCPVFDEICARTTNSEAMKAYIWSIIQPESYRQQYLWLHGDGNNSKSSLINMINTIVGEDACINIVSNPTDTRFFTSKLFGRRLASFPDSNTRAFVTTGIFKALTGDDTMEVEFKNQNSFSAKNIIKFIFSSNRLPDITSQVADIRRIILCEMDVFSGPSIGNYQELLNAEIPQILHKCKISYDTITKNHGPIKCDVSRARELAEAYDDPFKAVFENFFDADPESRLKRHQVRDIVKKDIKGNHKWSQFKDFLKGEYNIEESRDAEDRIHYFNGISLKGESNTKKQK